MKYKKYLVYFNQEYILGGSMLIVKLLSATFKVFEKDSVSKHPFFLSSLMMSYFFISFEPIIDHFYYSTALEYSFVIAHSYTVIHLSLFQTLDIYVVC